MKYSGQPFLDFQDGRFGAGAMVAANRETGLGR